MEWEYELLAGPYGGATEGPAWDGEALLFVHMPSSRIMRYDPRTGKTTEHITGTERTNGLALDNRGNLYGCQMGGRRIARFDADGTITHLPNILDGHRHNRPNDLAIDSQGRIWFTDCYGGGERPEDPLDYESVVRLDPQPDGGWTLHRMTYDMTAPNGILITQDERTLYVAQSDYNGKRDLRSYPIKDDGSFGQYIVLHEFGQDHRGVHRGVDGMCFDTEGNLIACAGWPESGPGSMIYVFAPSGRVLETHPIPVYRPTNCTFGGPDLRTLYITTDEGHLFGVSDTGRQGWVLYPSAR